MTNKCTIISENIKTTKNTRLKILKSLAAIWFNKICKQQLQKNQAKVIKTSAAIWFNKICKQQLQKHQAKVTKNERSHLV
jgi:hypothetical protein